MQSVSQPEKSENNALVHEPALSIQGLTYKVGLTTLLKEISFDLDTGSVLSLLGPNGAGKSTLLKCIAGLLPYRGQIKIFGVSPHTHKPAIGYLAHETLLYPKLTAVENLEFYASLYEARIDAREVLTRYGLGDAANQMVETFSRGMKQRLSLARVLISNPKLILMDEPFTSLDDQAREFLLEQIQALKSTAALILATHELNQSMDVCDRVAILKSGKLVFSGQRSEIRQSISDFFREKTA